jgi:hypothetical protein
MTNTKTSTVKGSELAGLVGQPKAVKLGSRWYWVQRTEAYDAYNGRQFSERTGLGFVVTVLHLRDPRTPAERSTKWRAIYADTEYTVRDEQPPVWEWVTKRLERDGY